MESCCLVVFVDSTLGEATDVSPQSVDSAVSPEEGSEVSVVLLVQTHVLPGGVSSVSFPIHQMAVGNPGKVVVSWWVVRNEYLQ